MRARGKTFWRQVRKRKWRLPKMILHTILKGVTLGYTCLECPNKKQLTHILYIPCTNKYFQKWLEEEDV